MNSSRRCPITYEVISEEAKYSSDGLKLLSKNLKTLHDFPFTAEAQRVEARTRAHKMSLQGVQIKLSALLNKSVGRFEIVDTGGLYILKPQNELYPQLAENEDLTMRLAEVAGINVPVHGMIYCADNTLTYFIKRFDRHENGQKLAVEDFAQLSGATRETKYDSSVERLIPVLDKFCTFPVIEKEAFFLRFLFNYLVGNEDMHLKNYSLITSVGKTELAPAYDLLNTSMIIRDPEESALPLRGKKRNLTKNDLVDYLGKERLSLNDNVINGVLRKLADAVPLWRRLIDDSFLSYDFKARYAEGLDKRLFFREKGPHFS